MKKPPIVEVQWRDSCAGPGWRNAEQTKGWIKDEIQYFSAGYLISKTKKEITLATGIEPRENKTHDLFQIPREAVVKIRKLK